jgi:hypothetical protein
MRKKPLIPIVSGGVKTLGLTLPEWVIGLSPAGLYIIIAGPFLPYVIAVHAVLILVYGIIISKLEENVLAVIKTNLYIKGIILGYTRRPLPYDKHQGTKRLQ